MQINSALKIKVFEVCQEIRLGNINFNNVSSIYGLLRESARSQNHRLTFEFGDFYAHSSRDKGYIKEKLSPSVDKLVRKGVAGFKGKPATSHKAIVNDINKTLEIFGVSIDEPACHAFCLVLFLSLVGSRVKMKDGIEVELGFRSTKKELFLFGAIKRSVWIGIPIFWMPNYFDIPEVESNFPDSPNPSTLMAEFSNGVLNIWQSTPPVIFSESGEENLRMTIRPGIEMRTGLVPPKQKG